MKWFRLHNAASPSFLGRLIVCAIALASTSFAQTPRDPAGRSRPTSRTSALHTITDCDDLRAFAVESFVDSLIYPGGGWLDNPWSTPGGEGEGLDFTGTNNQEAGVDELDIMKTDGAFVYAALDESVAILRSWPPQDTELVSRIPFDSYPEGIFVSGDRMAALSRTWNGLEGGWYPAGGTRIDLFDITDRTDPTAVRRIDIEGFLHGARLIGDTMILVVHTWVPVPQEVWDLLSREDLELPEIDSTAPPDELAEAIAAAREILTPLVADIVAGMELSNLLPVMSEGEDGEAELLLECTEVLRPSLRDEYSVLSVVAVDLGGDHWTEEPVEATGLFTSGGTIYASPEALYVAQGNSWGGWWWPIIERDHSRGSAIHAFELNPGHSPPASYRASGEVPGLLINQFSMSEYDGHLRVATYHPPWSWWTDEEEELGSLVTILHDDDAGRLHQVGQVDGIAPGETLFAARFLGERGYLVTFEMIDPLFSLDLSDPADPRITGELKIPGYSAYLHPMDEEHLLAIGMNGDEEGSLDGLAVKIFNVADPEDPTLVHEYAFAAEDNNWSWSEALNDHHAFTYHRGILAFPSVRGPWGDRSAGLSVLAVDPLWGIWNLGTIDHTDLPSEFEDETWSALVRRSAFIEDAVYSLSRRGVKVNDLTRPGIEYAAVPFVDPGTTKTGDAAAAPAPLGSR